MKKTKVWSRR